MPSKWKEVYYLSALNKTLLQFKSSRNPAGHAIPRRHSPLYLENKYVHQEHSAHIVATLRVVPTHARRDDSKSTRRV